MQKKKKTPHAPQAIKEAKRAVKCIELVYCLLCLSGEIKFLQPVNMFPKIRSNVLGFLGNT